MLRQQHFDSTLNKGPTPSSGEVWISGNQDHPRLFLRDVSIAFFLHASTVWSRRPPLTLWGRFSARLGRIYCTPLSPLHDLVSSASSSCLHPFHSPTFTRGNNHNSQWQDLI